MPHMSILLMIVVLMLCRLLSNVNECMWFITV